eukprot:3912888-Rhodomonas_salina.1
MAGNADPHYVQTLDTHTSENGPGELRRKGLPVEGALREQHAFLLSRVEGWLGGLLSRLIK